MVGFIRYTDDPVAVLKRQIDNLKDVGELCYIKTIATSNLEPRRKITKHLPKSVLWAISSILIFPFIARKAGRENGWKNARHTAYDWLGSHSYQKYFTN